MCRYRGDLIEVYKMLSGKENVDYTQYFSQLLTTAVYEVIIKNYINHKCDWMYGSTSSAKGLL